MGMWIIGKVKLKFDLMIGNDQKKKGYGITNEITTDLTIISQDIGWYAEKPSVAYVSTDLLSFDASAT